MQFTSTYLQDAFQTRGVHLTLEALKHPEMNGQVEVTWRKILDILNALIVHARVFGSVYSF